MKKLLSLILCLTMIILLIGVSGVNALTLNEWEGYGLYFKYFDVKGEDTFIIITESAESESLIRTWCKLKEGVLYRCYEDDYDERLCGPAEVITINGDEENDKVKIYGSIEFVNSGFDEVPVVVDLEESIHRNVAEIEIDNGVTSIKGVNGFALKKVFIGKDVKIIEDCFNVHSDLEVVIDEENSYLKIEGNSIYNIENNEKKLISVVSAPEYYEMQEEVTSYYRSINESGDTRKIKINSNLTSFETGETYIKKIILSDSVTAIDDFDISYSKVNNIDLSDIQVKSFGAENVLKLKSVVLPKSLEIIKEAGLKGTKKLQKINIPDKVKTIDSQTFWGSGITEITLSKKLKKIECDAFKNCKNLMKVTFKGDKIKKIEKKSFKGTPSGIEFYTPDTSTAKKLKNKLANSGVKSAKIYAGKKLVYSNVK